MRESLQKHPAEIDAGYETFQIIKEFDNPIEIFREAFQNSIDEQASIVYCRVFIEPKLGGEDLILDIWDNGDGLKKENIPCFFGLAKSTKINSQKMPSGKLGYKGHGTKIYFNAESVEIFSKPSEDDEGWGVILDEPITQLRENNVYCYSDIIQKSKCTIKLPDNFKTGFYVRIKNAYYFRTKYTQYMLNHIYLRDYVKWFTAFGTLKTIFEPELPKSTLYLSGINLPFFRKEFNSVKQLDPIPEYSTVDSLVFEKILMGHYFPPERSHEKDMTKYADTIVSNKQYFDYYSREIFKGRFHLDGDIAFDLIINVEGYETKRMYDVLLSRKTKYNVDKNLLHTDADRYGLWVCKGGIPIEQRMIGFGEVKVLVHIHICMLLLIRMRLN